MFRSLSEARRVLRATGWLVLVFMNSSAEVWNALKRAISAAGFSVEQVDIFDKQHGTFKHFVSENTPGCDLVLHCRPVRAGVGSSRAGRSDEAIEISISTFIQTVDIEKYKTTFLHVARDEEIDYRQLFSEWLSQRLVGHDRTIDFAQFRRVVDAILESASP